MTENILFEPSNIELGDNVNINFERAIELAERLDFFDIQILRKFYLNGKEYPFDSQPHCLPILYRDMKLTHQIKVGLNAFRYRINNLVKLGLLERISRSNPAVFAPVGNKGDFIRLIIGKFFLLNGLIKFLE